MIVSKACEYGIRVSVLLATEPRDNYVPVRELARRADVPQSFLSKICHQLALAGILNSHKGPNGGVALAREPRDITLLDIVETIDGTALFRRCALGLDPCGGDQPCPIHESWGPIRDQIQRMFSDQNLERLAGELKRGVISLDKTHHLIAIG